MRSVVCQLVAAERACLRLLHRCVAADRIARAPPRLTPAASAQRRSVFSRAGVCVTQSQSYAVFASMHAFVCGAKFQTSQKVLACDRTRRNRMQKETGPASGQSPKPRAGRS